MKKLKLFSNHLLLTLLSIALIVAAFLFLFIGCRGCENKNEKWHTLEIDMSKEE